MNNLRDESHVIINGLRADAWFAQVEKRRKSRQRQAIVNGILIAVFGTLAGCGVAAVAWWLSL